MYSICLSFQFLHIVMSEFTDSMFSTNYLHTKIIDFMNVNCIINMLNYLAIHIYSIFFIYLSCKNIYTSYFYPDATLATGAANILCTLFKEARAHYG